MAAGQQVCVTVTLLDGLVCARAVFHHSMNYRSAVIFGTARIVTEPGEKIAALRAVTDHLVPGRWEHAREPTRKELAATAVLRCPAGRGVGQGQGWWPQGRSGGLRLGHLGRSAARRADVRAS